MMRETSHLANVAAEMHLIDAPEGQSGLQTRLNEAEKRAIEAEATAQDAQAALARTLLDGAYVVADATARIKAESEAAIKALRLEFEAVKRSALVPESLPDGMCGRAVPDGAPHGVIALHEVSKPCGIRLTEWDLPGDRILDAWDGKVDLEDDLPPLRDTRAPICAALLGVLFVISVVSYSLMMFSLTRDAGTTVTAMASSIFGMAPTDMRLEGMAAPAAAPGSGTAAGNWLLYMPVERSAVMLYLAGTNRPL